MPDDKDAVLGAVRLGWYMAEVRGRNRPNGPRPRVSSLPSRRDGALPLRTERTDTELRIEAQKTLESLAKTLKVDKDPDEANTDVEKVDDLAKQLASRRDDKNQEAADATWGDLRELLFKLDAYFQDSLTSNSDTQACGYQLGRGLSEAYWGLDVEPPNQDTAVTSTGWTFLLGEHRQEELSRLAGRLSAYFFAYTCAALAGSLVAWGLVASDPSWRRVDEAPAKLYEQNRRWYELIVLLQDPSTLISPYAAMSNFSALWRAARALWLQLLLAVGSLVLVAIFVAFLSASHKSDFQKALFGILATLGVSTTAITTRLKNMAQAISTRFKQDAYTDLVAAEAAILPARPGRLTGSQVRDFQVRKAVKQRSITIATPPPA